MSKEILKGNEAALDKQKELQEVMELPTQLGLLRFNELLDHSVPKSWIKSNTASQGAKYLPIRRVEQLLRTYFGVFQVEFAGEPKLIANSVTVCVHLKVYHPVLKEWLSYAGLGSVPVQLDKGAPAADISKIKRMALHKNAPAALSFAVNNAAKKIGRIFGSDINNSDDEIMGVGDLHKISEAIKDKI